MMKKISFLLFSLLIIATSSCNNNSEVEEIIYADGEFPEKILDGGTRMRYQVDVDNFGANNYTIIKGDIIIALPGPNDPDNDLTQFNITDLTPLRSIEKIEGKLTIYDTDLSSLEGLHNLKSLGWQLRISRNPLLENLQGLRNLERLEVNEFSDDYRTWLLIESNDAMVNINGLEKLTNIDVVNIGNNPSLLNLDGLSGLTTNSEFIGTQFPCGDNMHCGNESLSDFCGLTNLFTNGTFHGVNFNGNAYTPSVSDIVNGHCSED